MYFRTSYGYYVPLHYYVALSIESLNGISCRYVFQNADITTNIGIKIHITYYSMFFFAKYHFQ